MPPPPRPSRRPQSVPASNSVRTCDLRSNEPYASSRSPACRLPAPLGSRCESNRSTKFQSISSAVSQTHSGKRPPQSTVFLASSSLTPIGTLPIASFNRAAERLTTSSSLKPICISRNAQYAAIRTSLVLSASRTMAARNWEAERSLLDCSALPKAPIACSRTVSSRSLAASSRQASLNRTSVETSQVDWQTWIAAIRTCLSGSKRRNRASSLLRSNSS